jgi:NAD(P)-dependent dehydrogenase (short-subunit alcohol dehydrogenase family)
VNDVGCDLSGLGRDDAPATRTAREIAALGGRAIADTTDIGSWSGGGRAVRVALDHYGRIDIVVNNAGITGVPSGLDGEAALHTMLAVHLEGTLGTMDVALPLMVEQGRGRVINTVSEVALDPRWGATGPYGIAKAAVWSATLSEAQRVDGTGVTVNGVAPGGRPPLNDVLVAHRGPATDLDPDHGARVVEFLAGDGAADVNGRLVFAAAGAVREYVVRRRADTPLAQRIVEQIAAG